MYYYKHKNGSYYEMNDNFIVDDIKCIHSLSVDNKVYEIESFAYKPNTRCVREYKTNIIQEDITEDKINNPSPY